MINVVLYSRKGCHLCEQTEYDLRDLQESVPHELVIIDIDQDSGLKKSFGEQIPVVKVGPYTLMAPFTYKDLEITLRAGKSRLEEIEAVDRSQLEAGGTAAVWTKADAFSYWLSNRYLIVLNLVVFLYVGLPLLAPTLMRAGAEAPAQMIYRLFGVTCHQLAFRSWFLFGEQHAYPRAAASVEGLTPFETATGIQSDDLYAARSFTGSPEIGYKIALCERDMSIYGAILLFGILFGISGRKIPGLPWYLWVLIGIVPVGVDGVSQLLSQPPLQLLPYRESTPLLRAITGGLFGFTTAWFGFPMVEEAMSESLRILDYKKARLARMVVKDSEN
jgi:uncharacterized membrane protein